MSDSKMTIMGLNNYLSLYNQTLFDNLSLPAGIDKETLIGSIYMRAGEFETLYPDPYIMRGLIGLWSQKHYWTFDKWIKAINIKYDPLNNYDRTEEYLDTHKGKETGNRSGNNSGSNTRTDDLKSSNDITTTEDVYAYNDSDGAPRNKTVVDQDTTNTGTVKDNSSGTYSENNTNSDEWTTEHKARLFGNIGVTTSQQMLQSELDIAKFNLYEAIADLFVSEFCILVY